MTLPVDFCEAIALGSEDALERIPPAVSPALVAFLLHSSLDPTN